MTEKETLRVEPAATGKDLCRCHICHAPNYGSGGMDVYNIKFERNVIRLCRSCAQDLIQKLSDAVGSGPDSFTNWRECLLAVLLGPRQTRPEDAGGKDAQLRRLEAVMDNMPFWLPYACLVKARSGKKPDMRPKDARDEYAGVDPDRLDLKTANAYVKDAIAYLCDPHRIRYIADGDTDLSDHFGKAHIPWLHENGIFVTADLEYWSDDVMLRRPGATSLLVRQALDAREALGYAGRTSKCRSPWEE